MKFDWRSAWERIVYGPDGDEEATRTVSATSTLSAATTLPIRDKEATGIAATQQDCKDDPTNVTSTAITDALPASSDEPNRIAPSRNDLRRLTWRPNFFQPRPFAGIAGLCITVGCVFGSLAILMVSDGQPVESWTIEPTVCLAIVAAIANSALRLARFQAIPISWSDLQ